MKYNSKTDQLEPTDAIINGDSEVLKAIAGNVKEFAGNWDAVWNNIELRGKIKGKIAEVAMKNGDDDMLEAPFVIKCSDRYHNISEEETNDKGWMDHEEIYRRWEEWFFSEVKKRGLVDDDK